MTSLHQEKNSTIAPCTLVFAIPARFGSTRLHGKPLQKIGSLTLVERVALRALQCADQAKVRFGHALLDVFVVVATDLPLIADTVASTGAHVVLTAPELASGTDRVNAAVGILASRVSLSENTLVVNIQGDEPFFCIEDVLALVQKMLKNPLAPMGTLAFARTSTALFLKSSVVKVVCNDQSEALTFSRAPLPWPRALWGAGGTDWIGTISPWAREDASQFTPNVEVDFLHHIGIYAYRKPWLEMFANELKPGLLEVREGLEQLRAVSAGWKILVEMATEEPFGIDTPADLEAANDKIKAE